MTDVYDEFKPRLLLMNIKMHSLKKVISRTKSYDIGSLKKTESEKCSLPHSQQEIPSPGYGYRHLVAFLGFLLCSLVSLHRTAMSVTIVAMVNYTEAKLSRESNFTASCAEFFVIQENSTEIEKDGEFNWNSQLQGSMLAISFFGFLFTNLFSGRLAEVWGSKRTLIYGNLLTALCTVLSPMAAWWNPYALVGVQFARGLSQGFTFSPLYVLMANWFPRRERGPLGTFVMCGFCVGALVGGLAAGGICDIPWLGWSASFYITGGFSVLITVVFSFFFHDLPHHHPHISKEELSYITLGQESDMSKQRPPVPWKEMFASVPVYALFIGMFGYYWSITYFMSVHPTFMGTILQYSMTENGLVSSLPFLAMTCGAIAASFGSVWIMKNQVFTIDKTRKTCSSISAFGFSICLLGVIFTKCNRVINILCFSLSHFFIGVGLSGSMIACGDMSPIFAGSLVSVASTLSGLSAAVMPVLVGFITRNETLQEWNNTFYMHISVVLSTALVFHALGSAELQPWNSPQTEKVGEKPSFDLAHTSKENYAYTNELSTEDLHIVGHMMTIFPKRITIAGIQQGYFNFSGENDKAGGVEGTLLNLIAHTLKFDYKLVTPADELWGGPTDDGNWTGMIGMVKRGEADWAMTAITVTDVRKAVVDFSEPYSYTEYSFATDLPSEKSRLYTYLYPFDLATWSGVLAVMVIFSVVIAKMHRVELSYLALFFLISGNLLRQDLFKMRTKNAYGVGWWWLIASVFSTSYTAVIASFLTRPLYESSVKTWKELSDAVVIGEYAAIVPRGAGGHLFRSSKEDLSRIARAIEKNGWKMDFEEVVGNEKLSRLKIAFVLPRMALYYKFGKPPLSSKFVSMDDVFSLDIAIAMSKEFCCKGDVDDLIVKIKEAGIYGKILDQDLFKIWIRSQKNETGESRERPMSFGDLSGAFLILGCGHLLAVVSFLFEKFSRRRKN